ncbi:hypothetical protein AB0I77_20000 [Streptomyces sp. NPDC050619]|uniref:hypothetical protein n=1 Tax=Streptomyces sp. NPDC050619 TaxID=3157214 RepID=UPI0034306484
MSGLPGHFTHSWGVTPNRRPPAALVRNSPSGERSRPQAERAERAEVAGRQSPAAWRSRIRCRWPVGRDGELTVVFTERIPARRL